MYFLPFFTRYTTFVISPSLSAKKKKKKMPFLKSRSFFQKGGKNNFDRVIFPKNVSVPLKMTGYMFKGSNSWKIVFASLLKRGSTLKEKNLLPKFFAFRVDSSSEGAWCG